MRIHARAFFAVERLLLALLLATLATPARSQGFIAALETDDLSMLTRRRAVLQRTTGEVLHGTYQGATLINGYMATVHFKPDSAPLIKVKPDEIARLSIRPSAAVRFEMAADISSSVTEMAGADFNEIREREFIIFEPARRANRAGTLRLMQLLNPGFDGRIKVFVDPNAATSRGISLIGVPISGGKEKSYLFVVGDEKAVIVRKRDYADNFSELYGGCPAMVAAFAGDRIRWEDVAGHVFVYDRTCR